MRSTAISISSLLLFACTSPSKPPLAAPSSLQVYTEVATPKLVAPPPKKVVGPLWTLCANPVDGFCIPLDNAREIRLRYSKEIARLSIELIDTRESLGKNLVREQEAAVQMRNARILGIGLGVGGLAVGLVIGALVGHYIIR